MTLKRSVRRRQKPPFAQRAKDQCRKFTAFMFSNVGIIMLVVIYTIAGKSDGTGGIGSFTYFLISRNWKSNVSTIDILEPDMAALYSCK